MGGDRTKGIPSSDRSARERVPLIGTPPPRRTSSGGATPHAANETPHTWPRPTERQTRTRLLPRGPSIHGLGDNGECDAWPVRAMCRVPGVPVSGVCAGRARPEGRRARADRGLLAEVRDIHAGSGGGHGSPRLHAALRSLGRAIGRSRVARLMRTGGPRGPAAPPRRVRRTDSRHSRPPLGRTVHRSVFRSSRPTNGIGRDRGRGGPEGRPVDGLPAKRANRVRLAGPTCIPAGEGRLRLAAPTGMHSRVRHGSRASGRRMARRGPGHARDLAGGDHPRGPAPGRRKAAPAPGVRGRP
jgi:hypothetical protein